MSFSKELKSHCLQQWEYGYNHPFVQELGNGTLELEKFKFYLIQDYFYLLQYAKLFSLGSIYAEDEKLIAKFSEVAYSILNNEMSTHKSYLSQFGITKKELEQSSVGLANSAYTSYMLSKSFTGNIIHVLAAAFPCAWTYAEYAKRLKEQYKDELENNPYKSWIDSYTSKDFDDSFKWFFDLIDQEVEGKSKEFKQEIIEIFKTSLIYENLFWDMSYNMQLELNIQERGM